MNKIINLLIVLIIAAACNKSKPQAIKEEKFISELKKEILKEKIPGCGIVVIKNGKIVISESIGEADVAFSVPVDNHTIFSINSIAKIFAGTAIMQLVEDGKINLSNPISDYLNNLPIEWQKVTIRQLLSHTSGLPDIEDTENGGLIGGKGEEFAWEKVKNSPLRFMAGEKFNYNATNYLLIQKLIEKISGMDYEKFLLKNQFDKIGSKILFGNSFDVVENKSTTYSYYLKDKITNKYIKGEKLYEISEEFSPILKADAGAFSTVNTLTKWMSALQNEKFISKKSIEKIWTAEPLNNGEHKGFGGFLNGYAYGWPVIMRDKHPAVAPIGGGRASLIVYPKDNLTIILLTNLTGSSPQKIIEKVAHHYWE
ncbi:serine hydrolase domain-containing protein [Kordia sp.]|uniref:serine hydrolase domain-containing protein n=1 Tax=Kordia sp. TaxID=1965332 RepID=UPI003D2949F8